MFDFFYNEIDEILMVVFLMESLEILNVKYNKIEYLLIGFLELINLRILECEDNLIMVFFSDVCCLGVNYIFRVFRD